MHEMSIAEQLLDSVIETAKQNDAKKIDLVNVELGVMRLVVPEALEMAFQACTKDTMADGAELIMKEVPVKIKCRKCDTEFNAEIGNFVCTVCGKASGEIIEGNEIIITSIECDIEED